MCLAVPAKIIEESGEDAKVDFGGGTLKNINVSLVEAKVGDYVIVHAGFAIQVLDLKTAQETLKMLNEIVAEQEQLTSQLNQTKRRV